MEAVRKWTHFLHDKDFRLITDQKALQFMVDPAKRDKIKSQKIHCWRAELGTFSSTVHHRPGCENVSADTLSRITACVHSSLKEIHATLGHPGVVVLNHFVKARNLPYSLNEVPRVRSQCNICAMLNPNFFRPEKSWLIKTSRPWERLSIERSAPWLTWTN